MSTRIRALVCAFFIGPTAFEVCLFGNREGPVLKKLEDMTMVVKLAVIAGMFMLILMVCGAFSTWGLREASQRAEAIYKTNLLPVRDLGDMRGLVYKMVGMIGLHIQAYDSTARENAEKQIQDTDQAMAQLMDRYAGTIVAEADRQIFEQVRENWSTFRECREKVLELSRLFSKDAAGELQNTGLIPVREEILAGFKKLIEKHETEAQESYQTSHALSTQLTGAMTGVFVVLSLAGLAVVWLIAKTITKNLSNMLKTAEAISAGNLTVRARITSRDEVGQLAVAFNQMASSLESAAAKQADALEAQAAEISGVTSAISRSQAVCEFNLDGTVITANDNFERCFGYRLEEIKGCHHRMFCDPASVNRREYLELWPKLNRGEFESGVYSRRRKDGQEIWVQTSYNPIVDGEGKVRKVVEYATDITVQKMVSIEAEGLKKAVERGQAVAEFGLDGTLRNANVLFLDLMGYRLDEIKGQHHRMFCDAGHMSSEECSHFWKKLSEGKFEAGVYRRLAKGGREVWVQATYNPILDLNGKPYKVVQIGTDITAQKRASEEMERLVAEAESVLGCVAENDLTHEVTGIYSGVLEKVKSSINAVVWNLVQTIATVREVVESVNCGSEEINRGNEELSQRTSEQASSLEETSASMEEITATVKQNADNAMQANGLAIDARETADRGGAVTAKAVEAMSEINRSSKKIADIITVIDEIAFQTNLLALNAAVEAARAGEHGRGFAVVATEVRNLAQRSAMAAREIKELINESIQRVTEGTELVNQSGKTLEEIVGSVKRVSDIIAEITAASQEQASGIDQMNKAIMSVDQTTQQNAALVEEITNASKSMKSQSEELLRRMTLFKIELSEADKAYSPSIASVREHTARSIGRAFGGSGRPVAEPRQVVPRLTAQTRSTVAVGGKGSCKSGEDFGEF
ncbi:MAG: hypothetical protein CV090_06425 [Nitrospira sp. WS238]|nr:hypothetical protein [Nitrospira sp. WS238]